MNRSAKFSTCQTPSLVLALGLLSTFPAHAFEWSLDTINDQGIYSATARVPGIIWMTCGGEVPGRSGPFPMIYQDSIAPAGTLRLHFAVEAFSDYYNERNVPGAGLIIDGATYPLNEMRYSDYYGSFSQSLAINAPLVNAIRDANSLTLLENNTARGAISARGSGEAITGLQRMCNSQGRDAPVQAAAVPQIRTGAAIDMAQVRDWAGAYCQDTLVIAPDAILRADVDGDGIEDLALNGEGVTCGGMRHHCGAALCATAIFLSSQNGAEPELVLGYGATLGQDAQGYPVFEIEYRCNDGTLNTCGPIRFGR